MSDEGSVIKVLDFTGNTVGEVRKLRQWCTEEWGMPRYISFNDVICEYDQEEGVYRAPAGAFQ